jgi:hypothetical protein
MVNIYRETIERGGVQFFQKEIKKGCFYGFFVGGGV